MMAKCKSCGAEINFIETVAGKKMPVDYTPVYYVPDGDGKDTIVTVRGETVKGRIVNDRDWSVGAIKDIVRIGHTPHFASCTGVGGYGREKKSPDRVAKKPAQKKPTEENDRPIKRDIGLAYYSVLNITIQNMRNTGLSWEDTQTIWKTAIRDLYDCEMACLREKRQNEENKM
jgi:hypothetical protein